MRLLVYTTKIRFDTKSVSPHVLEGRLLMHSKLLSLFIALASPDYEVYETEELLSVNVEER